MNKTQTDERQLPYNPDAEKAILSACITGRESIKAAAIVIKEPSDFFITEHQLIYAALLALLEKKELVSLESIQYELDEGERLLEAGGIGYLKHLVNAIPDSSAIEGCYRSIREESTKRRLIAAGKSIIDSAYDECGSIEALVDKAEQMVFRVSNPGNTRHFLPLRNYALQAFERVKNRYHRKNIMTGISTGFRELDLLTEGLQRKNLIVVASNPGMGETEFCMNMVQHTAIKEKKPVGVFSLDGSGQELARMILSSESRVNSVRMRTGYLENSDWSRLQKALDALDDKPIFIDDTPALTIMEMRSRARQLKRERKIELIVIDNLQQIRRVLGEENRSRELSEIACSLKEMSRELNIPVVVISQLSCDMEISQKKRPVLSDLDESGTVKQEADVILFIYREDYDQDTSGKNNKAEIIIAKQRDGCKETVELLFLEDFSTFIPVETDEDCEEAKTDSYR